MDDLPALTNDAPPALSLAAQVEALLFASGEPATVNALAAALGATLNEVEAALESLANHYQSRGIRLQRLGNRVRLVTAPELAERIQRFLGLEESTRLSPAALETLAIIAYNQPITKPQIEMMRRELRRRDQHPIGAQPDPGTGAGRDGGTSHALWGLVRLSQPFWLARRA